jgi:uncharacterized protein YjbI with pentapeptide repeats
MPQPFSMLWLVWLAASALLLILAAGAIWLLVPSWIAGRLSDKKDKDRLELEDSYRKALAQIIGFPLVLLGALGLYITAVQGLATYQRAQELAYQDQYRRGFDALASRSRATRIGGLYILQALVDRTDSGQPAGDVVPKERALTLLRALAAFAVEQPAQANQLVRVDALIALQIIANRKVGKDTGLDLRTGSFPGSILADGSLPEGADFRHFDFYKANLSGSDLYRAQLYQANLRFANLNGSNLAGADLTEAGLSGTTFCPAFNFAVPVMVYPYPAHAEMVDTKFRSAYGEQPRFDGAIMKNAIFDDSKFLAPSFVHAVLSGARFERATLDKPDFTGADLTDASFEGATLNRPIFTGAILNGTNLHAKGITDSDVRRINLCNVIGPSGARLMPDCKKTEPESLAELPPVGICQPSELVTPTPTP